MDGRKSKILAAATVISLQLLLLILWLSLGLSIAFFVVSIVDLIVTLSLFICFLFTHFSTSSRRQSSLERRSSLEVELRVQYSFLRRVAGLPTKFRYEALADATDNFRSLLGRGASASVFKGVLPDGTPVAVKLIKDCTAASERGDREFRSEVAAIASAQHVNLVRLLGYCLVPRGGPRLLVYDFVHNGSLDKWIFPPSASAQRCLPWADRYRVAIDVAKALAYLHHDCRARVLHLDVKPENILLDHQFRAVVSDFGLSKLMGRDESRVVTSTVRGTKGYLAPEWLLGDGVSEKCDVFSYGIVLLELVGGRRSVGLVGEGSERKWTYFPRVVMEKVREGRVMEVVDERVVREVDERQVRVLVEVGIWCIQETPKARPSMARVVDMLEGRVEVEALPPQASPPQASLVLDLLTMELMPPPGDSTGGTLQTDGERPMPTTNSFAMSSILSGR